MKAILISLVSGALAVTSAEYFFKYNLLDLLKDKLQGLVAHVPFFRLGDMAAAVVTLAVLIAVLVLASRI